MVKYDTVMKINAELIDVAREIAVEATRVAADADLFFVGLFGQSTATTTVIATLRATLTNETRYAVILGGVATFHAGRRCQGGVTNTTGRRTVDRLLTA